MKKIKDLYLQYKDFIMEVIHFGIVGVMNTLIGWVIMFGLYNLAHFNYWLASGISYFVGSVYSYFMNSRLTFKVENKDKWLPWRFALNIVVCYGAAFGILQNKQIFLVLLTAVILVMILYVYAKTPDSRHYLPIRLFSIMLAAGAVGNMYDRLVHGYVIDFLYAKLIDFPIFNVADCYVVISAIVLAVLIGFVYGEGDLEVYYGRRKD